MLEQIFRPLLTVSVLVSSCSLNPDYCFSPSI